MQSMTSSNYEEEIEQSSNSSLPSHLRSFQPSMSSMPPQFHHKTPEEIIPNSKLAFSSQPVAPNHMLTPADEDFDIDVNE